MSDREDRDRLLMAYVDGELDAAAALTVERMLAADPALRSDVEMFRSTAMLLRAACGEQHYAARPEAALRAIPTMPAGRRRTMGLLAASAALLAAGAGGGMWWRASDGDDDLLDDIARYHATLVLETDHLTEMGSDRKAAFSSWMSERLGRRLSAPDLVSVGLRYAGGRLLVVDDGPVADFLYTRPYGAPVGLCVVRATEGSGALRIGTRHGLRLASWSADGLTFIVVGDLAADAARRIADAVRDQPGA